jgi:predicted outer membrane protein
MTRKRLPAACALAFLAVLPTAVWAEPATARYAPHQLRVAEEELDRAEEAIAQRDYETARWLANQAETDARLAWGMTESEHLRSAASEVYRDVWAIKRQLDRARR